MHSVLIAIRTWATTIGAVLFCISAGAAGFHQVELSKTTAMLTTDITPTATAPEVVSITNTVEPGGYLIINTAETAIPTVRDISPEDRDLMAQTIAAEAENQPIEGKKLIAHVILNRVDSAVFPNTVEEVVSQPGQFETWRTGRIQKAVASPEDYEAVKLALIEPEPEPVYFFRNKHYGCGAPYRQVGDHYFSTIREEGKT